MNISWPIKVTETPVTHHGVHVLMNGQHMPATPLPVRGEGGKGEQKAERRGGGGGGPREGGRERGGREGGRGEREGGRGLTAEDGHSGEGPWVLHVSDVGPLVVDGVIVLHSRKVQGPLMGKFRLTLAPHGIQLPIQCP